jgi:hypothetical protein
MFPVYLGGALIVAAMTIDWVSSQAGWVWPPDDTGFLWTFIAIFLIWNVHVRTAHWEERQRLSKKDSPQSDEG